MRIYIGSAIDMSLGSPEQQFNELANMVIEALGSSVIVYNPLTAFANAHKITEHSDLEFVIHMNNEAITNCDAGVFAWTDSPSFGVPIEIEKFSLDKKPFIVWLRGTKSPGLYLRNAVHRNGLGRFTATGEETSDAVKSLVGLVDASQIARGLAQ